MNVSSIYDRSIKLLDESYNRLLKIWSLPNGSISKKVINNKIYFYHQYRDGKKVISKIVKDDNERLELSKKITLRKRYEKLNKKAINEIIKNIKVIAIFNKDLSLSLHDELFAYHFDEIPLSKRRDVKFPFITHDMSHRDINKGLDEYFLKWKNGEIRAREISNFIIQKLSD